MNLENIKYNDLKVINHEIHDTHFSVCVECKKLDLSVWYDISIDEEYNELEGDWNKYIFFNNNNDMKIKEFQENCDMYMLVDSIAMDFLYENSLVYDDNKGLVFRSDKILTNNLELTN